MADSHLLALQAPSTKYMYEQYKLDYERMRGEQPHSEAMLLQYLADKSKTLAPTTLWTAFSLVKKYLMLEAQFDIGHAPRITDYLKTLSRFHKKKKAPAFTREQVFAFLRTAPNDGRQLAVKLVLLCGYYAGLRSCEIVALTWEDIAFAQEGVLLAIRFSKTDRAGVGATKLLPKLEEDAICPVYYFEQYRQCAASTSGRLFCQFQNGKFTRSPMGKNTIAAIPCEVATFLALDFPRAYTGHSLRVSSATALADEGANSLTLKRHGRWASDAIAESYLRESKKTRADTAMLLAGKTTDGVVTSSRSSNTASVTTVFQNCVFNGTVVISNPTEGQ
jgi:integrase